MGNCDLWIQFAFILDMFKGIKFEKNNEYLFENKRTSYIEKVKPRKKKRINNINK